MKNKNWFEVSREGLKELQAGKDKEFVVKELIQNAWDENISICYLTTFYNRGTAKIRIEDDSPEGFRDIAHAFTLFAPTYKRWDPEKRGRFNIGEKQVLAICHEAIISTTKGTVVFDSTGRHRKQMKRKKGSVISLSLRMSREEYENMLKSIELYLCPKRIDFIVNNNPTPYLKPDKVVEVTLPTEIQKEDRFVGSFRKTAIHIHKTDVSYLYEMGLPVCEIDCSYSVNVQQKVPLSTDRKKVSQSYLRKIYTAVLDEMHGDVSPDTSSDGWVREAMGDKDIQEETVRSVIRKRYGDKVVVVDPNDRRSIDEAISHGYRVLHGSELSAKEWNNVRKAKAIPSSSAIFPTLITEHSEKVDPLDDNMLAVRMLVKEIAKRCLGINVSVRFMKWDGGVVAQYGQRTLTFNVKTLGADFFHPPVSVRVINLILHELAHEEGMHTQASYLDCLSRMAATLVMVVSQEPEFFSNTRTFQMSAIQ